MSTIRRRFSRVSVVTAYVSIRLKAIDGCLIPYVMRHYRHQCRKAMF